MNEAKEAFFKGLQALDQKNPAVASAYFEKANDLVPENLEHKYQLAYSYFLRKNYDKAMTIVGTTLRTKIQNPKVYTLKNPVPAFLVLGGIIHEAKKEYAKAIMAYTKAIEFNAEKKEALQKRIDELKKKIA